MLPTDVAKLVRNMGASLKTSFQAHIVETHAEEEAASSSSPEEKENVAEAAEKASPGSKFLDAEASAAAKELGKNMAREFQSEC
jgi:hypothetical protein